MRENKQKRYSACLITGATGGLGRALASELAPLCRVIILHGRQEEKLVDLARQLSLAWPETEFRTITSDLVQAHSAQEITDQVKSWPDLKLDLVVLNAGFSKSAPFADLSPSQLEELLQVNLQSQVILTAKLWDQIKALVVISSSGAYQPGPYTAPYYAAKSFLNSWALALQAEAPDKQILLVCPGALSTNFASKAGRKQAPLAQSPERVAQSVSLALTKKRAYLAPGIFNKLAIVLTKILPGRLNARLVRRIQLDQMMGPDIGS